MSLVEMSVEVFNPKKIQHAIECLSHLANVDDTRDTFLDWLHLFVDVDDDGDEKTVTLVHDAEERLLAWAAECIYPDMTVAEVTEKVPEEDLRWCLNSIHFHATRLYDIKEHKLTATEFDKVMETINFMKGARRVDPPTAAGGGSM